MQKALVTGGAGFIGYHLSKKLVNNGFNVSILDNFSDYYSEQVKRLNAKELSDLNVNIIEGSILDKELLNKSIESDYDIIFHFAAQPGVRYSTINPEKSLRVNIEGTSQILSVCREKKIKKIVVASSSSVFGLKDYLPIDEVHPKRPVSYYGVSKLAVEQIVKVSRHLYPESDISIIRPFTVIGTRQRPDMAINFFVSNVLNDKPITVFGDGNQTRDWTHVENTVNATYQMGIEAKAKNEDFNIGSGISTSVNEVLELISDITNKEVKIEYKPFDNADVKDTLANIEKAKKLLGYSPKKSLKIAIEEFIEDYNKNLSKISSY